MFLSPFALPPTIVTTKVTAWFLRTRLIVFTTLARERADRDVIFDEISVFLRKKYGIRMLGPPGFENTYTLAMPRRKANSPGVTDSRGTIPGRSDVDYTAASRNDLVRTLRPLVGSIDDTSMREAIKIVDIDDKPADAAVEFLHKKMLHTRRFSGLA